jgi:hypothetical protein
MKSNLLKNTSVSSKEALDWAFTWTRTRGGAQVEAVDLLIGISHTHGEESPLFQLLGSFNISKEVFFKQAGFSPSKLPPSRDALPGEDSLSQDVIEIINAGHALAQKYNQQENGLIRLKDLFGGLLTTACPAKKLLDEIFSSYAQVSIDQIEKSYLDYLSSENNTQENLQRWLSNAQIKIRSNLALAVSGFNADTRSNQDLVGIGTEVDAFSYLIASKDLKPPLAIGLFGDWGSGKSYFMQSLKERIYKITADAQAAKKPQRDIKIFKHIVQIEFNAWHYVEGELWASLVEAIFQNLQMSSKDEPTLLQKRQQAVIKKLESYRQKQGITQALKDELEKQLIYKQDEIKKKKDELDQTLKKLNELKMEDFLGAIQISPENKLKYEKILKEYGVTGLGSSAADFINALAGLRAVLQRGNALTTLLRQRNWKWTLAIVGVIISGPLINLILTFLLQNRISEVTNIFISLSIFLSGMTAILKKGTEKLSGVIGQVEQAQFELEGRKRQAEQEYANKIAQLESELEVIRSDFKTTQAEEQEITRKIAALENELFQITPRRVMLDFIQERAGSEDYRKRLGIAALIRRDFEQLWKLIEEDNKDFINNDTGEPIEKDEHLINRIVLYIDDLDRCPPDRVVQVLQAIHLLLAFPLFVVVVAVDSRWLSQSLNKQYEGLLSTNQSDDTNHEMLRPATPQNYLEKIFQIPFWVRPLNESARMRIVKGMIAQPTQQDVEINADEVSTIQKQEIVIDWPQNEPIRKYIPTADTEMNPAGLETQDYEHEFMENLAPLLGQTPRSVKRFVNLYWLMKSIALSHSRSFADPQSKSSEYKQVLLLLAILTGLPAIEVEFFKKIHQVELEHQVVSLVKSGARISPKKIRDLVADLRKELESKAERSEVTMEELARLDAWLAIPKNKHWQNLSLSQLDVWASQVKRFSYQMEEA